MNQLLRCERCQHVDMVDLAHSEALREGVSYEPKVCTKCLTNQWHGQFPYLRYNPGIDHVINPPIPG